MPKLYATLGLILLLGLAFWYTRTTSYQDGVNAERVRWQDQYIKVQQERDEWKAKAEAKVIDQRPVWNERKEKAREVIAECKLPDIHISVLRDSGIFTASSR